MSKITKCHNSAVFFKIYSKINKVVYSSLPVHSLSFKALASIVFEIFCWQDCIHIFSQETGIILPRKKYVSAIFSWGIHIRNFKTVACTCLKLCYASKSVTTRRTNRWMDEHPRSNICPSNFFEVGGITIQVKQGLSQDSIACLSRSLSSYDMA